MPFFVLVKRHAYIEMNKVMLIFINITVLIVHGATTDIIHTHALDLRIERASFMSLGESAFL